MTKRLLLAPLLLTVLLAACARDEAPAAATPAEPAAPTAAETVAGEPALDPGAEATTAAADPAADGTPAPAPDPAAGTAAAAASTAAPQGDDLVAGTDFIEIQGGQPYAPLDGKVEVVEVFAYWCAHCAQFDPLVTAWKAKLPADVRFTYLPAVFSADDQYPRAFFAAETAGILDRVHGPLFRAIHIERSLRPNAGVDDIVAFLGKQGADEAQIKSTMQSFAINAKLNRAKQFAIRSGIDSTPTLVVNGKYRVRGRTHEDALRIAEQLIARERSAATAGGGQ